MTAADATRPAPDREESRGRRRTLFRVGWWVLAVITGLMIANHALGVLAFAGTDDERALFFVFLVLGVLSLIVLWIPYRRLELWSWWASWTAVVAIASPLVLFPFGGVSAFYAGTAVLMTVAQLMTRRAFGSRSQA